MANNDIGPKYHLQQKRIKISNVAHTVQLTLETLHIEGLSNITDISSS